MSNRCMHCGEPCPGHDICALCAGSHEAQVSGSPAVNDYEFDEPTGQMVDEQRGLFDDAE